MTKGYRWSSQPRELYNQIKTNPYRYYTYSIYFLLFDGIRFLNFLQEIIGKFQNIPTKSEYQPLKVMLCFLTSNLQRLSSCGIDQPLLPSLPLSLSCSLCVYVCVFMCVCGLVCLYEKDQGRSQSTSCSLALD